MARRRWEQGYAIASHIVRADHGPHERWQHSARTLEAAGRTGLCAARVLEENLLDRLLLRGVIGGPARQAGLRLKADYHAAHLDNRVTASYNAARGINHGGFQAYERSDAEEAAYRRWRSALLTLENLQRSAVLDACCHDRAPIPVATAALRRGLAQLCGWYGIEEG